MIPRKAIEISIKGGWGVPDIKDIPYSKYQFFKYSSEGLHEAHCADAEFLSFEQIALDPTFWQALGKALGLIMIHNEFCNFSPRTKCDCIPQQEWRSKALMFMALVLDGKDTTQFWSDLLGNKE